jgi:CBS domain-containing protein
VPALQRLIDPTMAEPSSATAATTDVDPDVGLAATPLRALLRREPVTVAPTASIRETAELMRTNRVGSVLVVEHGRLLGIVTDRDMRNRVIARGLDSARPIAEITTAAPLTCTPLHSMRCC